MLEWIRINNEQHKQTACHTKQTDKLHTYTTVVRRERERGSSLVLQQKQENWTGRGTVLWINELFYMYYIMSTRDEERSDIAPA